MDKKNSRLKRSKKARIQFKEKLKNRLVVYRSSRHIYAQIINSESNVIVATSTLSKESKDLASYTGNVESASFVGKLIAEKALSKGINSVVFDRSGFKYHGRVAALAESARNSGLQF